MQYYDSQAFGYPYSYDTLILDRKVTHVSIPNSTVVLFDYFIVFLKLDLLGNTADML